MPKIHAATVAEHRAAQERALLDAARTMLAEGQVPGLADVARRTGLARSSVYQYFRSRQDLLIAVMEDSLPRWSARIDERMAQAADPAERVLAYVTANIELVDEGEHAIAQALATELSGGELAVRTEVLHDKLRTPLVTALIELDVPDPQTTAELVNAVVYAASRLVESGSDSAAVRARTVELLAPYLRAPH
ncbi:TetR/AcrR family transcriptional regulator [Nocardia vaccinii]|uniref:TetR/AcrR family transcriptional regulator n=1 Tax=Nocardia vaccinii TaxID=1822 RepID=UPI00082D52D2|nr:TetR/AcrR family transcriptional regulator [Nocardia vaccinii]